jgi:hypothetical protein
VRIRPLIEAEVRREATRQEIRQVLVRPTSTGLSGVSSGPWCRAPGCRQQAARLVAVMQDRSIRPAVSVTPDQAHMVVDTEWRCAGCVPAVPVVPEPGKIHPTGSVRLIKRGEGRP